MARDDLRGDLTARIDALADCVGAPEEWRAAMHAAPRHLFAPDVVLTGPPGDLDVRVDRTADPTAWWDAVYSDAALVTQLDNGATALAPGAGDYTSSCSQPSIVLEFLRLLRVYDHHRVLEIGTGTGWTAGLLSARLGGECVTSMEIDAAVAKQAAVNLASAGFEPHLVHGDGETGWPDGAPYDRVHVTAGVRDIPYAWVAQARPGGIVVLPWMPGIAFGHMLRLDVGCDGTAIGRFSGSAGYMLLRGQDTAHLTSSGDPEESTTSVDPRVLAWDSYGLDVALAGQMPGVVSREEERQDGSYLYWLSTVDGDSWAGVEYVPGNREYRVLQAGDRRLWDEAVAAFFRWQSWGRPARDRFGVTVTPDDQTIWLDSPANLVT